MPANGRRDLIRRLKVKINNQSSIWTMSHLHRKIADNRSSPGRVSYCPGRDYSVSPSQYNWQTFPLVRTHLVRNWRKQVSMIHLCKPRYRRKAMETHSALDEAELNWSLVRIHAMNEREVFVWETNCRQHLSEVGYVQRSSRLDWETINALSVLYPLVRCQTWSVYWTTTSATYGGRLRISKLLSYARGLKQWVLVHWY